MSREFPSILLLQGPNLNLLGLRDQALYGNITPADLEVACQERAAQLRLMVHLHQSNHEGELIDWVQQARENQDALIINAGALAHSSIALMDALHIVGLPIVEVGLTNRFRREEYRQTSYISKVADAVIVGLGLEGYLLALDACARLIARQKNGVRS